MTKQTNSPAKTASRASSEVKPTRVRKRSATAQSDCESAQSAGCSAASLADEEILRHVAEAAYYIAERRGFQGGSPEEDWLAAEAQIRQSLSGNAARS